MTGEYIIIIFHALNNLLLAGSPREIRRFLPLVEISIRVDIRYKKTFCALYLMKLAIALAL